MVFLRTNDFGRVQLRHHKPEQLSDSQKSDGVTVDSVPDRPDGDHELYVIGGSPEWKPESYRYDAQDDLEGLREHMLQQVEKKREEVERQGVSYNGHTFGSDAESRQSVVETLEYARDQNSFSTVWKTQTGYMQNVTESDLAAVRDKIAQLRQAAFDNEATLANEINAAATTDELASIDLETGWP